MRSCLDMALWNKTVGTRIIAWFLKSFTCETNFEQENRPTDIKAATKFHSKDAFMSLPKAHICELYADLKKLETGRKQSYKICYLDFSEKVTICTQRHQCQQGVAITIMGRFAVRNGQFSKKLGSRKKLKI